MKAEYINPFINSVLNVIQTMASVMATPEAPRLKRDRATFGDVTGVIGLAGNGVSGNLVVSFTKPCILKIVNQMLGESYKEINSEIVDAVGEITNMICGNTKRELERLGVKIQMATPIILQGQKIEISQLNNAPIITVPFLTDFGTFTIDANLTVEADAANG